MAVKDHSRDEKTVKKSATEARKEKQETVAALFEQADTGIKGHLTEAKRIKTEVDKGAKRQGRRGTTGSAAPSEGTGTTGEQPQK